jgi:hypothetical protein
VAFFLLFWHQWLTIKGDIYKPNLNKSQFYVYFLPQIFKNNDERVLIRKLARISKNKTPLLENYKSLENAHLLLSTWSFVTGKSIEKEIFTTWLKKLRQN